MLARRIVQTWARQASFTGRKFVPAPTGLGPRLPGWTRTPVVRRLTTAVNTTASPQTRSQTVWKVEKYGLAASVIAGAGYGAYLWQVFKETLMFRICLTEEEIEECRHTAMVLLQTARDSALTMTEDQLDSLGDKYYSLSVQRIESASREEYEQVKKMSTLLAWEYVYAVWELEPGPFDHAFLECRYFLIYTPEQLHLALTSPTARESLLDGILLMDQEIRDLAWSEGGVRETEDGFEGPWNGEVEPWSENDHSGKDSRDEGDSEGDGGDGPRFK